MEKALGGAKLELEKEEVELEDAISGIAMQVLQVLYFHVVCYSQLLVCMVIIIIYSDKGD